MNYWKKKCDPGVVSCFVAQGEYDSQDPMFRGCAGNYFPHDQKCEFQEQVGRRRRRGDILDGQCIAGSHHCGGQEVCGRRSYPLLLQRRSLQ